MLLHRRLTPTWPQPCRLGVAEGRSSPAGVFGMLRRMGGWIGRFVAQGVDGTLPAAVAKRIRLTNAMSLLGAAVMLLGIPFDATSAPTWMLAEDVAGAFAFVTLPLLNRCGYFTLSRLLCLAVANVIVLGNAVLLGRESGAQMVLFALCAIPFTVFDLSERVPLASCVLLSITCFVLSESDLLARLQGTEPYMAVSYYRYSAGVTLVVLLFGLFQSSLANARAERALREDISKRERAERELERTRQSAIDSAKMAALGAMSGNVAHEVNNPLAAILLRAQRLRRLTDKVPVDLEGVSKAAADIEATVHRIRRIVDALRSFARDAEKDPLRPERVSAIVQDAVELCAQRFDQNAVTLEVEPIPADLFVECRAIQISQILLNLLSNAYDAVVSQDERRVRILVDPAAGGDGHVQIAVVDSGPGVPPELEGRIMQPFFTTKNIGQGTGLGLSLSKVIAEAHGGRLVHDVRSAQTRFVLTLRRAAGGPAA
jgi:signal transduction histidine kinase